MKILLVEGSEILSHTIQVGLGRLGYAVDAVVNGSQAIHCLELNLYEVMVLDIMMPGVDGFAVLDWMRLKLVDTKVIVISAKDTVLDRVKGLERGANDYLVKPFAFEELAARIRVQARDYHKISDTVKAGPYTLNIAQRTVAYKSQFIPFSLSEYNMIEFLFLRTNCSFVKEKLRNQLYDFDQEVDSQVIEVMVSNVRKKLKGHGVVAPLIQTRRGYGYHIAS